MVSSPTLLFPLYIYPTSLNTWAPLFNALTNTSSTSLIYTIIINPSDGPGSSTYPDENYINAISTLNSPEEYSSFRTLGYVHTSTGTRDLSDVFSDIDRYAGWAGYSLADIHVDGIFFDEAPSDAASEEYMLQASEHARSALANISVDATNRTQKDTSSFVVYNPGVSVSSAYLNQANLAVQLENTYSAYNSSTFRDILSLGGGTSTAGNTSMILTNVPGDGATQGKIVQSAAEAGLGGLFLTTKSDYHEFPDLWEAFVDQMANSSQASTIDKSAESAASTNGRQGLWWARALLRGFKRGNGPSRRYRNRPEL